MLEVVYERDIDLLLLEELRSDERFARWFYGQAWGDGHPKASLSRAWHSLCDSQLGESDLVAVYVTPNGRKLAILIEDKTDAPAQSRQAERYRERGEEGIRQGSWDDFRTCLVAPSAYLQSKAGSGYQAPVSYEDLCRVIRELNTSSRRHEHKVAMLMAAIEQQRRGYSPRSHEQVTKFWREYWEYASREFPELGMKEPESKPGDSYFVYFAPPQFPKKMWLIHKMRQGCVDLNLGQGWPGQEELEATFGHLLVDGLSVERTGKTFSIRTRVPAVDHVGNFELQVLAVREALKAADRLRYVGHVLAKYRTSRKDGATRT